MKTISRRKNSEDKQLKKKHGGKNFASTIKKLRIKDFQGTFKKNGEKQKIFQGEKIEEKN